MKSYTPGVESPNSLVTFGLSLARLPVGLMSVSGHAFSTKNYTPGVESPLLRKQIENIKKYLCNIMMALLK